MEYMRIAVEEYLENNRRVIERLCSKVDGIDINEEIQRRREEMDSYLETNRAYGMLLTELNLDRSNNVKDYIYLSRMAQLKDFKKPQRAIDNWFNDEKTQTFLFKWEYINNSEYYNAGLRELRKRKEDPAFVLTLKSFKETMKAKSIHFHEGEDPGIYVHRDIAIDFYIWTFPEKRCELIQLIAGKLAFLNEIEKDYEAKYTTTE